MEYYSTLKNNNKTKQKSYGAMKRHGGIVSAHYQVKEDDLKRRHTVRFQLRHSGGGKAMETVKRSVVTGEG